MNDATRLYIRQHADDDVRRLALRGAKDAAVDMPFALQQIQGRQTARRKLPSWADVDAIVYPPHLNMEQCSSEQTARYKADLCRRLLDGLSPAAAPTLVDLTGGFGVDFAAMSAAFAKAIYVECDPQLFAISSQNFQSLGLRVSTVNADAADVLAQLSEPLDVVYLDPARRDVHGARTYALSDCTPDVLLLLPMLLAKSRYVLLKLSPMLEWRKAVADVGPQHVAEVHIVAVRNECKELLLLLEKNADETALFCVNDDQVLVLDTTTDAPPTAFGRPAAGQWLFEPNASVMKAGCFGHIASRFGVTPVARDSHLFVADSPVAAFPGRSFVVERVTTMKKNDLRRALDGMTQANISTRNFPLSVAQLRSRLRLADGGDAYLFATTLSTAEHVLLVCRKG